jgi:hypothetical protein
LGAFSGGSGKLRSTEPKVQEKEFSWNRKEGGMLRKTKKGRSKRNERKEKERE